MKASHTNTKIVAIIKAPEELMSKSKLAELKKYKGKIHLDIGFDKIRDRPLLCIIEREGDGYVSLCPELDIASQGRDS